ncbi:hypothetical protein MKX01_039974 [Papaver californicum]|nr:hypothetical protein MKX01_039974 [Papaver californicum]
MNFPAKIAGKFPVLGLPKLRFLNSRHRIRGFMLGLSTAMEALDLKSCGLGLDNRITRAVLPATEGYVDEATQAIKEGKVIAVPTDTLYGFACDACSAEAVHRIYEIKGRKQTSPLAICVGDVKDIERFAVTDHLPNDLLTSANLSGQPTSVCIKDFENLWEHCKYVYDGGLLPSGRAGSTVVDLTKLGKYKILRPGR